LVPSRLNVEGRQVLEKDLASSAVVNIDKEALRLAKENKRKALADKQKIVELEQRLERIEKLLGVQHG
jgi:hypothetical protein